jgi:hypothetical protein
MCLIFLSTIDIRECQCSCYVLLADEDVNACVMCCWQMRMSMLVLCAVGRWECQCLCHVLLADENVNARVMCCWQMRMSMLVLYVVGRWECQCLCYVLLADENVNARVMCCWQILWECRCLCRPMLQMRISVFLSCTIGRRQCQRSHSVLLIDENVNTRLCAIGRWQSTADENVSVRVLGFWKMRMLRLVLCAVSRSCQCLCCVLLADVRVNVRDVCWTLAGLQKVHPAYRIVNGERSGVF